MTEPEQSEHGAQRAFLAHVLSELLAVRRARLLSMLVLALAMLVAGLGAAMQAQGTQVDTVLLFSAFSLIMIGIVCALGAIVAWTRINRDLLDAVASARPARARAPRSRNGGMAVAIGFAVLGLLCGWMLFQATPVLAIAIVLACSILACLGPIWANELSSADDRFAVMLDSDEELAARFHSYTPIWLHDAMEPKSADEDKRA